MITNFFPIAILRLFSPRTGGVDTATYSGSFQWTPYQETPFYTIAPTDMLLGGVALHVGASSFTTFPGSVSACLRFICFVSVRFTCFELFAPSVLHSLSLLSLLLAILQLLAFSSDFEHSSWLALFCEHSRLWTVAAAKQRSAPQRSQRSRLRCAPTRGSWPTSRRPSTTRAGASIASSTRIRC